MSWLRALGWALTGTDPDPDPASADGSTAGEASDSTEHIEPLPQAYPGVSRALPVSEASEVPVIGELLAALDTRGWTPTRIAAHARSQADLGQPWPHRVHPDLRQGIGAAQFQALLNQVREALNLTTLEQRPPSPRTELTADERRLLAEVPPHHGV